MPNIDNVTAPADGSFDWNLQRSRRNRPHRPNRPAPLGLRRGKLRIPATWGWPRHGLVWTVQRKVWTRRTYHRPHGIPRSARPRTMWTVWTVLPETLQPRRLTHYGSDGPWTAHLGRWGPQRRTPGRARGRTTPNPWAEASRPPGPRPPLPP